MGLATSVVNRAGEAKANPGAKEEEWKDYEEDIKDFSNLKIETLKVESDSGEDEDKNEIKEEPNKENEKESQQAPPKKEENTAAPAKVGGYVPPHMRGGSSGGDTERQRPSGGRMNRGKNAPDLNAMNFPSLSDSAGIKDGSKNIPRNSEEKDFETARGGGAQQHRITEAPKLSTNNRFSAIQN